MTLALAPRLVLDLGAASKAVAGVTSNSDGVLRQVGNALRSSSRNMKSNITQ
jgi:hypothetical protein